MRVVCISDTHLQHNFAVPDGDLLVHAGDALNSGRPISELQTFLYWFKNLPHRRKVYVPGNHDWLFDPDFMISRRLAALEMMRDTDIHLLIDQEIELDGLRIYGSPWQPEFYGWAFNLPRGGEQLRRRWAAIPEGLDVLITHGPPEGVLDRNTGDERCGCELLRERVRVVRPRLHVFGHIHSGYGRVISDGIEFVNAAVCTEQYRPLNPPQVVELSPR